MPGLPPALCFRLIVIVGACLLANIAHSETRYYETVQPVVESRCVACHACYSSPCQLNLTHPEGLSRGASKALVYNGTRLLDEAPTRLFQDAHSVKDWRKLGFFSVTDPVSDGQQSLSSVEHLMIWSLRSYQPLVGKLDLAGHSQHVGLRGPEAGWSCPSSNVEISRMKKWGRVGMPYDLMPMPSADQAVLMQWAASGFPGPDGQEEAAYWQIASQTQETIDAWEAYLNTRDPRQRILSRYLFEHLFLAKLVFPAQPDRIFRVVRSRTAAPDPVDEIATRRPYDDPGEAFFYRLRLDPATRMHKSHIVFPAGPEVLQRLQTLFDLERWPEKNPEWPSYSDGGVFNAFRAYKAIPVDARYRFFLDHGRYFLMTFIRGPVCEGQVAVNVINDYFFTAFVDPEYDLSVQDPAYLEESTPWLGVPPKSRRGVMDLIRTELRGTQRDYAEYRTRRYREAFPNGLPLEYLWSGKDGDQSGLDRDRALTVLRHHDTASVLWGWQGDKAQAVWILDYPIIERIYYLLVAGFDVYGSITHQTATRLYMDKLRIESQQNWFDLLMPAEKSRVRNQLNRGDRVLRSLDSSHPLYNADWQPAVSKAVASDQKALLGAARRYLQLGALKAVGSSPNSAGESYPDLGSQAALTLQQLAAAPADLVQNFPDFSVLLIESDREADQIISLVRNRSHLNVNELFQEEKRLVPEEDTLLPVVGLVGSYPNLIFRVDEAQLPLWLAAMRGSHVPGRFESRRWAETDKPLSLPFAIHRLHPEFWETYDRVQSAVDRLYPVYGGRLDLSKYTYQLNTHQIRPAPTIYPFRGGR